MIAAIHRKGTPTAPTDVLARRFWALVVDLVLINVASILLGGVYGVTQVTSGFLPQPGTSGFGEFTSSTSLDWWQQLLLLIGYFTIFEVVLGRTPGKLLLGIVPVSVRGGRAAWPQRLTRNILRLVDALPWLYLVGGITVLTTDGRQRIGDRVAGTTVVRACSGAPDVMRQQRLRVAVCVGIVAALAGASLAFDYYGRPPLALQGDFNTGQEMAGRSLFPARLPDLGQPVWGAAEVTYPYRVSSANGTCQGVLTLRWSGFFVGWHYLGGDEHCAYTAAGPHT